MAAEAGLYAEQTKFIQCQMNTAYAAAQQNDSWMERRFDYYCFYSASNSYILQIHWVKIDRICGVLIGTLPNQH